MKPTFIAVIVLVAALLIMPAAMAQNVEPGNHYSGIEAWQENSTQYGPAPVDPIELASKTSGSLYIFIRSAGCLDEPSRQISIANMDGKSVLHEEIGVDGHFDIRLPVGKYFIVLPKGTGSSWDDTTWKQETDIVMKLIPLVEEKLAPFDARPHWAKLFTISPQVLQSRYSKLSDFKQLINQYDPGGKFRNAFLDKNLYGS